MQFLTVIITNHNLRLILILLKNKRKKSLCTALQELHAYAEAAKCIFMIDYNNR